MSIHPPDDELDERWKAMHEHPEFAEIPSFDALDLAEKSHANDKEPAEERPQTAQRKQRRVPNDEPAEEEPKSVSMYDDGPHDVDEQIGHDMLLEEYQNWISRPTVVEVDDYPL